MKFIGDPRDQESPQPDGVDMFGVYFRLGEATDVSSLEDWQLDRLKGNSHFEAAKRRGRPAKAATPIETDEVEQCPQ